MFNLFLNPNGELNRQKFWVALIAFTVFIVCLNAFSRWIGVETLTSFLMYCFAIPALIYSVYQVFKKRLRHMGYTVRPIWIFLFLWFFLMLGCFVYFGAGDHLNAVWELNEQFKKGQITEAERDALIRAKEEVYRNNLSKSISPTEIILTIPAGLFMLWIALMPGKDNSSERKAS